MVFYLGAGGIAKGLLEAVVEFTAELPAEVLAFIKRPSAEEVAYHHQSAHQRPADITTVGDAAAEGGGDAHQALIKIGAPGPGNIFKDYLGAVHASRVFFN